MAGQLKCSPAGQQVEDQNDDCQDQEDVDPAAKRIAADQSEYPENEKNDGDRPKHVWLSCGRQYDLC